MTKTDIETNTKIGDGNPLVDIFLEVSTLHVCTCDTTCNACKRHKMATHWLTDFHLTMTMTMTKAKTHIKTSTKTGHGNPLIDIHFFFFCKVFTSNGSEET